jgi:hypothetical protein
MLKPSIATWSHCKALSQGLFSKQAVFEVSQVDETKKSRWKWPLGLVATGLAGAAVVVFRGCWHRKMSWPVRSQGYSYQVCTGCGIKRLFDEEFFQAYGPYSYDLGRLIAWDRAQQPPPQPAPSHEHRSAS